MTTPQAARILKVHHSRVRQLIASGRLQAEKHGNGWWITADAVAKCKIGKPGRPRRAK